MGGCNISPLRSLPRIFLPGAGADDQGHGQGDGERPVSRCGQGEGEQQGVVVTPLLVIPERKRKTRLRAGCCGHPSKCEWPDESPAISLIKASGVLTCVLPWVDHSSASHKTFSKCHFR